MIASSPNPERDIFLDALEIPDPARRENFLNKQCADDAALRSRIDKLLSAANQKNDPLDLENGAELDSEVSGFFREVAELKIGETSGKKRSSLWSQPDADAVDHHLQPRFSVEKKIGSGKLGALYRGKYKSSEVEVAIRILPTTLTAPAIFSMKFLERLPKIAGIQHQNLVPLIDFDSFRIGSQKYFYVVSKFYDSPPLYLHFKDRRFTFDEVVSIFKKIIDACEAGSASGYSHGSLSTDNIFIGDDGTLQIADFGLNFEEEICDIKSLGFILSEFDLPEFSDLARRSMLGEISDLAEFKTELCKISGDTNQ